MLRKSKFFVLLNILLVVMLMLTGCDQGGGDATPADGGDNGGSETTGVELPQTVEADLEGAKLTVKYPDGWVGAATEEGVNLANSQELMDKVEEADSTIEEGDAFLIIMVVPADEEVTAKAVVEMISSEGDEAGEVVEFTTADNTAYRVTIEEEEAGGIVYGLEYGEDFVAILNMVAAPGKAADYQETAEAILSALTIEAVEAEGG
jgi:hypothetical protein